MISTQGLSNKVLLVILDGYGINKLDNKNAIKHAITPNLDNLFKHYPYTELEAGGESVGLPEGVMGNSEVGHLNLGSGRPIKQDLVKINEIVNKKKISELPLFLELSKKAKNSSKRIHLMGLLSDGGVHSHINHIKEFINTLNQLGTFEIFFHALMDGRDTPRNSGINYITELNKIKNFTFASIQGRAVGMDRDQRWEKTQKAYEMLIGNGKIENTSPENYIKNEYENEIYDEFITPNLFSKENAIRNEDVLFFVNYRPDRAIQMTLAFADPNFKEFQISVRPQYFLCMTPYVTDIIDLPILFDKEPISNGLCEYLSNIGKKQFKIAETEKFAHVTYFFNGGIKEPFQDEDRVLIQSPKHIPTYDHLPQMSAFEVRDNLLQKLNADQHDLYIVNFANCDMVGHTGNYQAALKAVATVDECVGDLLDICREKQISLLLTADHGNSDQMTFENGTPHTAHTNSPVPVALFHPKLKDIPITTNGKNLSLKDIAPTILYIMNIEKPESFSGNHIFR